MRQHCSKKLEVIIEHSWAAKQKHYNSDSGKPDMFQYMADLTDLLDAEVIATAS